MKIKNILAATTIITWSGMACAGPVPTFSTWFGQTSNADARFPLQTYSEAVTARDLFVGSFGMGAVVGVHNFESDPVGSTVPFPVNLGSVTATLSGAGEVKANPANDPITGNPLTDNGRFSVSGVSGATDQGSRYWSTVAKNEPTAFSLDFGGAAIQAFGFFATDIGDFGGSVSLKLTLMDDSSVTVGPGDFQPPGGEFTNNPPITGLDADGSVLFFGVSLADKYFKAVQFIITGSPTLQEPGGGDVFGFDMFTIVSAPTGPNPTPLPGSLALVGAALGGLALVRRRR